MNWKSEPPDEHGLYWWRPNTMVRGGVVNVYENKSVGVYVMATIDGMTWALPVSGLPGEWSDRVPEPVEKGPATDA